MYEVIHQEKTNHHKIRIAKEGDLVSIYSGGGRCMQQSSVNVTDLRKYVYDYLFLAMHFLMFKQPPKRSLVIGLGGGIIPRELSYYYPDSAVDVIEIDERMEGLATEYLHFERTPNMTIHVGDAFNVVDELDEKYDFIFMDGFNGHYVPLHLMSIEFFKKFDRLMDDECIVANNIDKTHPTFLQHVRTLYEAFGDDCYYMHGITNILVKMMFFIKGRLTPVYGLPFGVDKYPEKFDDGRIPQKFEFTNKIRNAKVFSIETV